MQSTALGSTDVAIALGSLILLSFSCLLYARISRSEKHQGTDQIFAKAAFKGLTQIAAVVSVLGWVIAVIAAAKNLSLPFNPWLLAISGSLVASALTALYWGATIHIRKTQPPDPDRILNQGATPGPSEKAAFGTERKEP